jgi:hypothetical protein
MPLFTKYIEYQLPGLLKFYLNNRGNKKLGCFNK